VARFDARVAHQRGAANQALPLKGTDGKQIRPYNELRCQRLGITL
jgi:hypothetical protein